MNLFIIILWQFCLLYQQLYYYNTLTGGSTARLPTVNYHFSFLIKYLSKISPKWPSTHFNYVQNQRSTTKRLLMLPPLLRSNTPLGTKWFYWPHFKFRKPPFGRIKSLQNHISLFTLISISRPQTYNNWTFSVLLNGTVHWMNHVHNIDKVSCFKQKHSAAKRLPTWQLMDDLSRLRFLSTITASTHSYSFSYLNHL